MAGSDRARPFNKIQCSQGVGHSYLNCPFSYSQLHADLLVQETSRGHVRDWRWLYADRSCGHNSRKHAHNGNNVAQLVLFPEG